MRLVAVSLSLILLSSPLAALEQRAGAGETPPRQENSERAGRGIPAAVRRVERQTGGQVLNVESMRFQGRDIHRVKVLEPGGRIRVVVDDPASQRDNARQRPAFRSTRGDDAGKPNL